MTDSLPTYEEEQLIEQQYQVLIDEYLKTPHEQKLELIRKAFDFAKEAHKGVRRRSGEPYIMHPLAVATIVVKEIGLGSTSICAALLHDVVEDTNYTTEDIEREFGKKIAVIVEGLTKIAGGVFGGQASMQAENYRKLILTMSEDIRVILIKIADRLHNMRTLGSMPVPKQYKIAGETQYIYAPLAHRFGLFPIKTELENLAFKYEHPDTYDDIERKLNRIKGTQLALFEDFVRPVREKLTSMGIQFTILARIKTVYSIWRKMQAKHIAFEDVYDILAVRIVFTPQEGMSEKDQCWMIYSALTEFYRPHPERIRDWISTPKLNGYEALHVTVMGNDGQWIEVQIRTNRMNELAEKGLAAHWKYKAGKNDESELDKWLRTIKEMLENPQQDAVAFMDTFKLNLFAQEVFVFTPRGDIKTLPKGATALDFAYSLHTDLGNQCVGAKANHNLVPLNYTIKSGDQIEILSSDTQQPQEEWLEYVTTAKAKQCLTDYFRHITKQQIAEGEALFQAQLEAIGRSEIKEVALQKMLNYYQLRHREELMKQLGQGIIPIEDMPKIVKPKKGFINYIKRHIGLNSEVKTATTPTIEDDSKHIVLTDEKAGTAYKLCEDCHPIPGDEILGFRNEDGIAVIHKMDCEHAALLRAQQADKLVTAEWHTNGANTYIERIEIEGIDKVGVIIKILDVISEDFHLNLQEINVRSDAGIFKGEVKVQVHDKEELKQLCTAIQKVSEVQSIHRTE